MFEIKTMNSISPMGVEVLEKHGCRVGADVEKPQALLIRSAELHGYPFNEELLCIARAGAGTNNIPVEDCAEKGMSWKCARWCSPRATCWAASPG